jgi:UDPglucose 6-dehydrogenase
MRHADGCSVIPLSRDVGRQGAPVAGLRVAVIGAGYVGLVTAACLAKIGHQVICADIDGAKIDTLNSGRLPIYEPGLDELAREAGSRLEFTANIGEAARLADVVVIAVGTPAGDGGMPELRYVDAAVRTIARQLAVGAVVVVKSTVPVGTAAALRRTLQQCCPHDDFSVAANPEFLREGSAVDDFLRPDRVVVGVADERAEAVLRRLYRPLTLAGTTLLVTGCENAELIKYAANAFLAMKITFINEIAELCERFAGDVAAVARGIGLDARIGSSFLQPGPGYGGSCFPKDTRALAGLARQHGAPCRLVETVIQLNERRQAELAGRVVKAMGGSVRGKTVGLLGLAFKSGTDDIRESAALVLLKALQARSVRLRVHDPQAMENGRRAASKVVWCDDPYAACRGADAVVIATEWNDFRKLDMRKLRLAIRGNLLVDFRNLFSAVDLAGSGLRYVSVGRPPLESPMQGPVDRLAMHSADMACATQVDAWRHDMKLGGMSAK